MRMEELPQQLRIEEIDTPVGVVEYFAFADPVLEVDWGDTGVPPEYTPEYIASHPDVTKIFVIKDAAGEIIAGAKVTKLNDNTRHRLGLHEGPFSHQNGVLLEYTVVREDYQNQGLLKVLTEKRLGWAKEQGTTFACTEIAITTPISAHTKIRDGFVFIDIKPPGEGIVDPYFVVVKQLSDQEPGIAPISDQSEKIEVEVNEKAIENFPALFAEGWVGVGIKNIKKSGEPPWTLVLAKP